MKSIGLKTISLNPEEMWPLLNVLNEACHGLNISNFEKLFGKRELLIDLMDRLAQAEEKVRPLVFNNLDLEIIKRSFIEVFKEIEAWEFQTRIGIPREEAIKIQEKIDCL
ncbi:MAG: hypothetical protein JSR76_01520 [Verrucomicrobia bacterium]|nr:hypothetical protein [Verrucomicrobiota bacterium]